MSLDALGCGRDKAVRLFKELDTASGIGLIERCRQGRPARIYVKNFTLPPPHHKGSPGSAEKLRGPGDLGPRRSLGMA